METGESGRRPKLTLLFKTVWRSGKADGNSREENGKSWEMWHNAGVDRNEGEELYL